MAESPGSDASNETRDHNTGTHKPRSAKDKQCQFCKQPFTSSSLGRHLDQYLSKKKPDGIHDLDEIRRLRGVVTRRTAKHSRTQDHEELSKADSTPAQSQAIPHIVDHLNGVPADGLAARINSLNWLSTGVISDLPPTSPQASNPSTKRTFSTFAADLYPKGDKDASRALELALREVLDAVKAATARASPRSTPFAFDFPSQTFPSLCLALLPRPATLFSPSPFSTSNSAPLCAPDARQLDALRNQTSTVVNRWRWSQLLHAQTQTFPTPTAANLGEEVDAFSRSAAQYEDMATKHLDLAYSTWMEYSDPQRDELWQIELLRAFYKEQDKTKELEERVAQLTQDANRLQEQVEYLSRCQWPREMALWPPERVKFTNLEAEELRAINLLNGHRSDPSDHSIIENSDSSRASKWDFDRLLNKWKKHVQEDKGRRISVAATHTGPPDRLSQTSGAADKDPYLNPSANTLPPISASVDRPVSLPTVPGVRQRIDRPWYEYVDGATDDHAGRQRAPKRLFLPPIEPGLNVHGSDNGSSDSRNINRPDHMHDDESRPTDDDGRRKSLRQSHQQHQQSRENGQGNRLVRDRP